MDIAKDNYKLFFHIDDEGRIWLDSCTYMKEEVLINYLLEGSIGMSEEDKKKLLEVYKPT